MADPHVSRSPKEALGQATSTRPMELDLALLRHLKHIRPAGASKHFQVAALIIKQAPHEPTIFTRSNIWRALNVLYDTNALETLYYTQLEEDGQPEPGYQLLRDVWTSLEAPQTPKAANALHGAGRKKGTRSKAVSTALISPAYARHFIEFQLDASDADMRRYFKSRWNETDKLLLASSSRDSAASVAESAKASSPESRRKPSLASPGTSEESRLDVVPVAISKRRSVPAQSASSSSAQKAGLGVRKAALSITSDKSDDDLLPVVVSKRPRRDSRKR